MWLQGFFNVQRLSELKIYHKILPEDSVAPKIEIGEAIQYMEEEQKRIALINAQAQLMQQRGKQFLMGDPDEQSSMMADAMMQQEDYSEMPIEGEEEVMAAEEELPELEEE